MRTSTNTFSNGETISLSWNIGDPHGRMLQHLALRLLARLSFTTADSRRTLSGMFARADARLAWSDWTDDDARTELSAWRES